MNLLRWCVGAGARRVNQIKALLVTAPKQLRELSLSELVHTSANFRPGAVLADPSIATKTTL